MSEAAKMKPRRLHSATTLSMVTTSSGTRPVSLGAVVAGDRLAVGGVLAQSRVEVRRVLDLVLGAVDPDGLGVDVDAGDEARRQEDGLAEDRRPGVDQHIRAVDVVDHVLHLADTAVDRLDGHAVEVGAVVTDVVAEAPEVLGHPDPILYSAEPMPIYEFRCENGHLFEVMQRITDAPVTECETCGAPVTRVFHPIAVHFKGSGFYNTDYGTAKRKREMDKSASDGADKHDAKQADKKKTSESKPAAHSKPAPSKSSDS